MAEPTLTQMLDDFDRQYRRVVRLMEPVGPVERSLAFVGRRISRFLARRTQGRLDHK